jgi:hypothetical protein
MFFRLCLFGTSAVQMYGNCILLVLKQDFEVDFFVRYKYISS